MALINQFQKLIVFLSIKDHMRYKMYFSTSVELIIKGRRLSSLEAKEMFLEEFWNCPQSLNNFNNTKKTMKVANHKTKMVEIILQRKRTKNWSKWLDLSLRIFSKLWISTKSELIGCPDFQMFLIELNLSSQV